MIILSEIQLKVFVALIGMTLGSVIAFLASAQLCEIRADNGWPIAFYVTGKTVVRARAAFCTMSCSIREL
jgi:hypothetical protein